MATSVRREDMTRLKRRVKDISRRMGANLVGIASVESWEQYKMTEEEFYPQNIWEWSKSVIVLGVQIFLPMLETTPSVVYSELYNTTNRLLDDIAYKTANFLNQNGFRAFFFPRDCYGDISVLVKKPEAAFSQVIAGYFAGLGTIGANHTLLTPEYGPRVRLVSVITDAVLKPDPMIKKDICIRCGRCISNCPQSCFTARDDRVAAEMDKHRCAAYHEKLKREYRYPCGLCTAVCPVGEDRQIYGASSISEKGIRHVQSFGSKISVGEYSYIHL